MAVGAYIPLRSRVVRQVANRSKYNDESWGMYCRGVLMRSTVRELAGAESVYGAHVREFRRVGGVPRALMPVLCFSSGGVSHPRHPQTISPPYQRFIQGVQSSKALKSLS